MYPLLYNMIVVIVLFLLSSSRFYLSGRGGLLRFSLSIRCSDFKGFFVALQLGVLFNRAQINLYPPQ